MPQIETSSVNFRNNDGSTSNIAQLSIVHYDKNERLKRALARLGLCWAAAVLSIPIILAHYILIPAFLIAGPVLAREALRMEQRLDKANGVCPSCNEDIQYKFEAKDSVPKWTYCPNCEKALHIDH